MSLNINEEFKNCWKCKGLGLVGKEDSTNSCKICSGTGSITRKKRQRADLNTSLRPIKFFPLFHTPGPQPILGDEDVLKETAEIALKDDKELSFLCGKHRIFQSSQTHKYSTDDVVTAWVAWRARLALSADTTSTDTSLSTCDIGCGIGSVLLMTRWLHPNAKVSVGIEAQTTRSILARQSAQLNWGKNSNVIIIEGDLREESSHIAAAIAATEVSNRESLEITPSFTFSSSSSSVLFFLLFLFFLIFLFFISSHKYFKYKCF
jgi:hypothetical protein